MQNFMEYVTVSTLKKKSWIIDCVLPDKEKLLGSAHAQQRLNASPTSGV